MLELSTIEIVSLSVAIISIIFNVIQAVYSYLRRNYYYKPIYNGLFGLFNNIKGKSLNIYGKQNLLFKSDNPHNELNTVKWDYFEFTQEMINFLDGVREHIVSTLKSMQMTEEPYKASEFGLTDEEKKQREEFSKQYKENQKKISKK